jgi:hypothetical protein|tara:strand:- start:1086 stop:1727 length:642 start_codon:yes stop_codon:yes gene_type:complete
MNSAERFEVVFHGEMTRDNELMDVKFQMGAMFNLDADRLEALFSGEPQIVKRNLSRELADRYRRKIAQAGGFSVVAADTSQPQPIAPDEADAADDADEQDDVDPNMVTVKICICPACGHKQLAADLCNRCNIEMDKYATAQRIRNERERTQAAAEKRELEPQAEAWREDLAKALQEQQAGQPSISRDEHSSSDTSQWSLLSQKVRCLIKRSTT